MLSVKPTEYDLFVSYGRRTKEFLKKVFYLNRYPPTENTEIAYVSPSRAFVKYLVPIINGGNINPTITFYFDGAEYLENENLLGFVKEYKEVNGKIKGVPAPLIYKLNYKVKIMCATPTDSDRLAYQILAYARKNNKMAEHFDGQWIEWYANSLNEEMNPEPGLEDRVYSRSLMLTIPRAYLPVDFAEFGKIENIDIQDQISGDINNEE